EKTRGRQMIKQQVLDEAKAATAPAPTPLPKPSPPPIYKPAPVDQSLLETLDWAMDQHRNGHTFRMFFELLPPGHQSDVERVARKAIGKTDVNSLQKFVKSIQSVGDLIVTRQRWIFAYPKFEAFDEDTMDLVEGNLLLVAGLIRDGLHEDTLRLDEFSSVPMKDWVREFDNTVAPYMFALMDQAASAGLPDGASFEVLEEKDGVATVQAEGLSSQEPMKFTQMDGQWKFTPDDWDEGLKKLEEELDAQPDGQLLAGVSGQIVPTTISLFIQPAFAAQSAGELHGIMDGWFQQAAPMLASFMPPPGSQNGMARGGGMGGMDDGYGMGDDYYEGDMGMEPGGMGTPPGLGRGGPGMGGGGLGRGGPGTSDAPALGRGGPGGPG
ncbi:MAG: hypothetical protein AAFV88_00700, partial [Planctomycetota bacterium]